MIQYIYEESAEKKRHEKNWLDLHLGITVWGKKTATRHKTNREKLSDRIRNVDVYFSHRLNSHVTYFIFSFHSTLIQFLHFMLFLVNNWQHSTALLNIFSRSFGFFFSFFQYDLFEASLSTCSVLIFFFCSATQSRRTHWTVHFFH